MAKIPKSCSGTHEKWSIVFSSTYHINWGLTFMLSSPDVWVMPVLWTLWQFWETGPKIMSRDTQKVIQILFTLLIKLSFNLFSRLTYVLVSWVFVHWGNFDKVDRNTPKSFVGTWKIIQSFYSSTFHMRWGHKQTSWLSESQNHFCLLFLGSSSHLGHLNLAVTFYDIEFHYLLQLIYLNFWKLNKGDIFTSFLKS